MAAALADKFAQDHSIKAKSRGEKWGPLLPPPLSPSAPPPKPLRAAADANTAAHGVRAGRGDRSDHISNLLHEAGDYSLGSQSSPTIGGVGANKAKTPPSNQRQTTPSVSSPPPPLVSFSTPEACNRGGLSLSRTLPS